MDEAPRQSTPPVYDPLIATLTIYPWFLEAHAAIDKAVQDLRAKGFKGTINVSGGSLHVR